MTEYRGLDEEDYMFIRKHTLNITSMHAYYIFNSLSAKYL